MVNSETQRDVPKVPILKMNQNLRSKRKRRRVVHDSHFRFNEKPNSNEKQRASMSPKYRLIDRRGSAQSLQSRRDAAEEHGDILKPLSAEAGSSPRVKGRRRLY